MSGFAKPTSLKSALKLALYGPAGSGKTFTICKLFAYHAMKAQDSRQAILRCT